MGFHTDSDLGLGDAAGIASFSLGATRRRASWRCNDYASEGFERVSMGFYDNCSSYAISQGFERALMGFLINSVGFSCEFGRVIEMGCAIES